MKRAVLTGGTGFVGANLARSLLQNGHQVHLLVRPGYQSWRIHEVLPDLVIHEVDLLAEERLSQHIRQIAPDWVFHLAAHGAYSWEKDPYQIAQTNILGTLSLLNACLKTGFDTFINVGSSSEYGYKEKAPGEDEWLEPNSDYAVAKASATLFCRYYAQKHRTRIFTLRLYSAYGPYEDPRRFIPALLLNGMQGKYPPLANPDTARDYVYVEDVSRACMLAASTPGLEPGAIYNVGTGVQTTLYQAVDTARRLFNLPGQPAWGSMPGRAWDTNCWVANNEKISRELAWIPQFSFEQGLELTRQWFSQHPAMVEFYQKRTGLF